MNIIASDVAPSIAHRWSRRLWWLAAPLAFVWFFFWGLLWDPAPYTPLRGVPRFVPHARFLPGRTAAAGDEAQRDLRVMWSPVLFALPTPMGFSRTPAAGDGHDRPRVQRPSLDPILLLPPQDVNRGMVVSAAPVPAFAAGDHFNVDGVTPVFDAQPAATQALVVELLGELAVVQPLEKPLPAVPPELAADSWGVSAQVDVGREGGVRHVFLDPPSTSTDFNVQLLQMIYRWRFTPPTTDLHGTIRLYHVATPRRLPPEVAQP